MGRVDSAYRRVESSYRGYSRRAERKGHLEDLSLIENIITEGDLEKGNIILWTEFL